MTRAVASHGLSQCLCLAHPLSLTLLMKETGSRLRVWAWGGLAGPRRKTVGAGLPANSSPVAFTALASRSFQSRVSIARNRSHTMSM